jgi:N-acetylneuraminic acid mutarotase
MLKGDLYIFGGFTDNQTSLNDLWRFSTKLAKWERVVCTTVPQASGGATMISDEKNNRLILFGGRFINNNYSNNLIQNYSSPNIYRNELHIINLWDDKTIFIDFRKYF